MQLFGIRYLCACDDHPSRSDRRIPGHVIMAVKCEVKMRAIKYLRYLGGNNTFELTKYLTRVYMAQYSGLSNYLIQLVNVKVKFFKHSGAVDGFCCSQDICSQRDLTKS